MNEPADPLGINPYAHVNVEIKIETMETEETVAQAKMTKNELSSEKLSDNMSDVKMQQITYGHNAESVFPQRPTKGSSGSISAQGINSATPGTVTLPQGTGNIAPEYILSQGTAKAPCYVASGSNNLTPEPEVMLGASDSAFAPVSGTNNVTIRPNLLSGTNSLTTGEQHNDEISTETNVGSAALQQMFKIKTTSGTAGCYITLMPEVKSIKSEADAGAMDEPKESILSTLLQQRLKSTLQDGPKEKTSKAVKHKTSKTDAVKSKTKRLKVEINLKSNRPVRTGEQGRQHCLICAAYYKWPSDLIAHSKVHIRDNDNQLECDSCQIFFDTRDEFNVHVTAIHQGITTKCDFCEASFVKQKNMTAHARSHTDTIGNECKDCGVFFINRKQWDAHTKLHLELYECHLCDRKFAFNNDLYTHLKDHPEYLPYKCEMCTNGYKDKREWLKHMQSHKHGPHQCEICNRTFRRKNYVYSKHMLSHAPFACHLCNESYDDIKDLKQHMRDESHEYACYACNQTFLQKLALKEHLFEQHIDALKQKYNSKTSFF